jgi:hypothetical protein
MYGIKKDMLIERIENKVNKNIFKINFKDEKEPDISNAIIGKGKE